MTSRTTLIITALLLALGAFAAFAAAQGEATPQALPLDAGIALADLVYTADFATEANWQSGGYNDNSLTWEPVAEGLSVISPNPEGPARFLPGTRFLAQDFYAEISFTPTSCASGESAMLFNVRSDPTSESPTTADSYVFVVQCDGTYRSRVVNNGRSGLIDFSGSLPSALTLNEPIFLGVALEGRQISWYINGELLGTYLGSANPITGQFALGAQLGLHVTYNSLRVWALEGVPLTAEPAPPPTADDPLATSIVGRNIVVQDFSQPIPDLIASVGSVIHAYRVQTTLVIGTALPLATYYFADAPDPAIYDTFQVEVVFQVRQCPPDGAFGLALGEDEDDFYGFFLHCDGSLTAVSYTTGTPSDPLLESRSEVPQPFGFARDLSLVISNDRLYAYADGNLLGSFEATDANQRKLGIVWHSPNAQMVEVTLGSFTVVERLPR